MNNFVVGIGSGLYLTGFSVGLYNSLHYSNKIFKESSSQPFPHKLISYYGVFICSFSMGVSSGFTFIASPILLPIIYSKKYTINALSKMDDYDIITFVK